jgi:hypothetical protein
MATGMACAWMRVGAWKPILSKAKKLEQQQMISKKKVGVKLNGCLAFSKQRKTRDRIIF